jgi:hypothetical protein
MGRKKGKLVTPRQYATMHGVPYTTVMYWLQSGKIKTAVKHQTPTGHHWELPDNTPAPPKLRPGPKGGTKKRAKKKSE